MDAGGVKPRSKTIVKKISENIAIGFPVTYNDG
jgi:hypothetical protein